ncbi:MAG TPA: UDP-N-acetylmuramate dehydrogenase [Bacilli bacterium]
MQEVVSELRSAGIRRILLDEPMSNHTTWKIGGPADLFVVPETKQQLADTINILHRHRVPWMKIGRGSNMLVLDKGIRGAVVKLGGGLDYASIADSTVTAGAAYGLIKLSVVAGKAGLTGLEFAGGIPGSVGGAVYMNAGAHGSDISRILASVEVLDETGKFARWSASDLCFAYRHSKLQQTSVVVTEAVFQLAYGDRKEIAAAMAAHKNRRLQTQPLQSACAGSVFRNPENQHAAKLIEQAGLKGTRVGGAEISPLHANFIVNVANATANDVLTLIELIQNKIFALYKVRLIPEVLVVGER